MTLFGKINSAEEMNIGFRAFTVADQVIPTGVDTPIAFNGERYVSSGGAPTPIHSTAVDPTMAFPPVDGVYHCGGNVQFEASSQGLRKLMLRLNGTQIIAEVSDDAPPPATPTSMNVSCNYRCVVGDFIELIVFQSSVGDLDVLAVAEASPEFWVQLADTAGK